MRRFVIPLALSALSVFAVTCAGCKKTPSDGSETTAAVVASSDSGALAAPPTIADAGSKVATADAKPAPVYHAFSGRIPKGSSFWIGIEKRGDALRAVYRTSGNTDFSGKMSDATHFSLREGHVPKGEKPETITGELSQEGALLATLTDPKTQKKTQLTSSGDPEGDAKDFKEEFTGSLGGRFIRMKLEKSGTKLTGIYRYSKSAQDIKLEGTMKPSDGSLSLDEKVGNNVTGHFNGIFVSKAVVLGQWSSPDGARTFPVKMEEGTGYPETVDLGSGLTLYPQETMIEGKRCKVDITFPQIRGAKDAAKATALNALLRGGVPVSSEPGSGNPDKTKTCEGPGADETDVGDYETSESYGVLTQKKGRFVSIQQGGYSYLGGAHGSTGSDCTVIDEKTLTNFHLGDSLTDAGRKKLGELATKSLQTQNSTAKLTDLGFYNDDVEVQKTTSVCLSDTKISVEFAPYEVAPYVAGAPSAEFPKADVRDLFIKNDLTDAIFTQ